ncbi:MAG: hypothetical protein JW749_12755 [Sedimentisphaerales bacterium]|nr:hypothetical protein [Sedimentisphaerales bacterium]
MRKNLFVLLFFVSQVQLFLVLSVVKGFVSTNVTPGHWSYDAIDKLIGQGLIDGSMMTTKPVTRFEMARHIAEADEKYRLLGKNNEIIDGILTRLKKEFAAELATIGAVDGNPVKDYVKPVEDPYIKYLYGESTPDIENIRGVQLDEHSNLRAGFESRGQLFDVTAFYLHPEYRWSSVETNKDFKLIEAYGKLQLGKVEIEVGKDSLWWGPGQHGALLMSNNAEPFKMVKISNPTPVELPWIFKGLGPFKAVWFLTLLEKDRPVPEPKLTGLRVNFKPHPAIELGLSRAIIFGGDGRPDVALGDYLNILFSTKGNREGKFDTDELAGFDASVLLPIDWLMPAKSVKLYGDFIGEDEAGGMPSNFGKLIGAKFYDILRTGKTDFVVEYANNHIPGKPDVFYAHHIYQAGYTYMGRIIGHYMGTDSENLFFRLTHYLSSDVILGLQYDRQKSNLSSSPKPTLDQIQCDLTLFGPGDWEIQAGYRYENADGSPTAGPGHIRFYDNKILFMQLIHNF